MFQNWTGIGYLGRDAELTYLPSGNGQLKFSIAIDDSYQDRNGNWVDRTYWIPVNVTMPSLVKSYEGRLTKGTLLIVQGKLVTYTYSDNNGQTRSGFVIEASSLRIIPRGNRTQNQQPTPNTQQGEHQAYGPYNDAQDDQQPPRPQPPKPQRPPQAPPQSTTQTPPSPSNNMMDDEFGDVPF